MSVRSVVPGSMVSMKTWFIVAVLCELTPASCATDWGYDDDNGPSVWATTLNYTTCGSESQSPVDIVIADCEYDDLGTFTLDGFENEYDGQEISMENNGHTVLIHLDGDYFVSGAGLSEYKAHYFHFHWGSDNSQGSEHEIDGDKKAAEFHLVCYNEDLYGSYTNALGKKGGIAVLGFLIEAGEPNSAFDALLNEHYNVANKDDEYTFTEPFQLLPMFPSDLTRFYRYEGSTTTPPCYENVTWTVFKEVVEISEDQLVGIPLYPAILRYALAMHTGRITPTRSCR
uniref:carbonic anhydrase n=1 Tax=Saccoglossus kowalevskii TaxID=10224 RepID=A0ABM0MD45_SACKO|nr:PREDICTED: carbonic anhydrase 12-like [Saccoglossus kowalevskii]